MKAFMVTSDVGKKIRPVQKYLLSKYAPQLDQVWIDLGKKPVRDWCNNVASAILSHTLTPFFEDEYCMLWLDDHLLVQEVKDIPDSIPFDRVELGDIQKHHSSCKVYDREYYEFSEETEYQVSTQPSVWRVNALIQTLTNIGGDPWDFEVNGRCHAGIVKERRVKVIPESAISKKWHGVNLRMMLAEDVEYILKKGWLTINELKK